ncbi:ISA2 [Candida pseudojiufengensis]|uniref:ISA2 n=1 Tax=Candida pseudojiufengensis TaxID=497109 RepID=UPI0022245AED|nr:ISA2 [Candida pseudojiufengensis]KAI5959152.1 ISA2 [Candida pseudojiufengensis]
MISRYTRLTTKCMRILPRVSNTRIINPCSIRFNSSSSTRTLKPSSFTSFPQSDLSQQSQPQPKSQSSPPPQQQQQQTDIDDFKQTKLIHGKTNKVIAITDRASSKLNSIKIENPKDTALQIQVESGGCHGFQYNLNLINLDTFLKQNEGSDDIFIFERNGGKIILDDSSLNILQDSKLDYTKELIGSQFKIIDSPYTSTACGCGASFDFDFEKLEEKERQQNTKS